MAELQKILERRRSKIAEGTDNVTKALSQKADNGGEVNSSEVTKSFDPARPVASFLAHQPPSPKQQSPGSSPTSRNGATNPRPWVRKQGSDVQDTNSVPTGRKGSTEATQQTPSPPRKSSNASPEEVTAARTTSGMNGLPPRARAPSFSKPKAKPSLIEEHTVTSVESASPIEAVEEIKMVLPPKKKKEKGGHERIATCTSGEFSSGDESEPGSLNGTNLDSPSFACAPPVEVQELVEPRRRGSVRRSVDAGIRRTSQSASGSPKNTTAASSSSPAWLSPSPSPTHSQISTYDTPPQTHTQARIPTDMMSNASDSPTHIQPHTHTHTHVAVPSASPKNRGVFFSGQSQISFKEEDPAMLESDQEHTENEGNDSDAELDELYQHQHSWPAVYDARPSLFATARARATIVPNYGSFESIIIIRCRALNGIGKIRSISIGGVPAELLSIPSSPPSSPSSVRGGRPARLGEPLLKVKVGQCPVGRGGPTDPLDISITVGKHDSGMHTTLRLRSCFVHVPHTQPTSVIGTVMTDWGFPHYGSFGFSMTLATDADGCVWSKRWQSLHLRVDISEGKVYCRPVHRSNPNLMHKKLSSPRGRQRQHSGGSQHSPTRRIHSPSNSPKASSRSAHVVTQRSVRHEKCPEICVVDLQDVLCIQVVDSSIVGMVGCIALPLRRKDEEEEENLPNANPNPNPSSLNGSIRKGVPLPIPKGKGSSSVILLQPSSHTWGSWLHALTHAWETHNTLNIVDAKDENGTDAAMDIACALAHYATPVEGL